MPCPRPSLLFYHPSNICLAVEIVTVWRCIKIRLLKSNPIWLRMTSGRFLK
jgi:hypothetical protein